MTWLQQRKFKLIIHKNWKLNKNIYFFEKQRKYYHWVEASTSGVKIAKDRDTEGTWKTLKNLAIITLQTKA